MIRSLYVRIVLMFLAAVIIGLISASVITGYIYQKRLDGQVQNQVISLGHDIIRAYEKTKPDNISMMMNYVILPKSLNIRLYTADGKMEVYGSTDNENAAVITQEQIQKVLKGETLGFSTTDTVSPYVGMPFKAEGRTYAMFIQPNVDDVIDIGGVILTLIILVLIIGSLFFIVEANFLIRPLRKMTEATKRMAKGDFNVALNVKRKDELGTLARSFEDMTRELKQLEQMRQDFISNVSHEIQSPLTSISGFAKALKNDALAQADRDRYLDIIMGESQRLSRLSDNLLQLASLEADQHPFQTVTFRLDEQIRQAVVAFEPQWSAKNIAIELELPAAQMKGDRDQLNQVWINLLCNSIKFTPEGGRIDIGIRKDTHDIVVTIADSGIGISPEDQKRMFERFYKADRSRNRRQNGNGLGLSIVKRILDLHQGAIEVRSEAGKGTSIDITFRYMTQNNSKQFAASTK